jgi:hypothetical protein
MLREQAVADLHYRVSILESWGPDKIFRREVLLSWLKNQSGTKQLLIRLIYLMPPGNWATQEFSREYEEPASTMYLVFDTNNNGQWTVLHDDEGEEEWLNRQDPL